MTLGDQGAVALEGDRFHVAPAFKVNVVDNTGAGDVFRAAFIYGFLQRWSVPEQLRFANAAAAVSCTRLGAIPSVPALDEVAVPAAMNTEAIAIELLAALDESRMIGPITDRDPAFRCRCGLSRERVRFCGAGKRVVRSRSGARSVLPIERSGPNTACRPRCGRTCTTGR